MIVLTIIYSPQVYSMASQYENVSGPDYDVVRSTQFVEETSHGVRNTPFGHVTYVVSWPRQNQHIERHD